jgi:hypothetical protein
MPNLNGGNMYSPKVNEKLVVLLYHLKQKTKKPMTVMVSEAVSEYIIKHKSLLTKEVQNEQTSN